MNIFVDDLSWDEIDFNVFYNDDGEAEEIEEMEEERLRNIISMLERQIKMLPEHYNVEIWEEYKRRCKEELRKEEG